MFKPKRFAEYKFTDYERDPEQGPTHSRRHRLWTIGLKLEQGDFYVECLDRCENGALDVVRFSLSTYLANAPVTKNVFFRNKGKTSPVTCSIPNALVSADYIKLRDRQQICVTPSNLVPASGATELLEIMLTSEEHFGRNPLVEHWENGICYYIPSLLLIEAMCWPSMAIARHLLSPLGLETLCFFSSQGRELIIQYLPSVSKQTSMREDLCVAFWAAHGNRDSLLYPLLMSIKDGTPLAIPQTNEDVRMLVQGIRLGSNFLVTCFARYPRKWHAIWPADFSRVKIIGPGGNLPDRYDKVYKFRTRRANLYDPGFPVPLWMVPRANR